MRTERFHAGDATPRTLPRLHPARHKARMTLFYPALALTVAALLLGGRPGARLAALVAAAALGLLCWSIWLADLDGTFAAGGWRPVVLNAMMALGIGGSLLLLMALFRRNPPGDRYPAAGRLAHWTSAVLMLAAVPMGLFVAVLPAARAERADFLAAHVAAGLVLLALLPVRLWLRRAATPAAAPARAGQALLYLAILAGGLSGLTLAGAIGLPVLGALLPAPMPATTAGALHLAAAGLFALAFAAHLTGALVAHFARRETLRMV